MLFDCITSAVTDSLHLVTTEERPVTSQQAVPVTASDRLLPAAEPLLPSGEVNR